jgi:galactokinase
MIVATAPGRCGVLGNPTDMYGGSVISCSTRERARCEIREATDS